MNNKLFSNFFVKMNMLKLGDQHKPLEESLEVEFKEFCLNNINVQNEQINEYITGKINNKIQFNQDIYKNIKYYFYKYIPKYTSAFINANINGELIIGVNDYGEITGVPFFGSKNELEKYIKQINIEKFIKGEGFNIEINIKKLKIDTNYITNESDKLLKEYYKNIKEKDCIIKKYKIDRLKWVSDMDEYTCKLSLLLENKKNNFEKYLKIHAPTQLGYIVKECEMRHISHLKIDESHYIYWLMKFKDENLTIIKSMKPEIPQMPRITNGPKYLYKHLTNLRYKFINKNKDLNYFIINVKITRATIGIQTHVLYYDLYKKMWFEKIRKLHKDGPKCESSESDLDL